LFGVGSTLPHPNHQGETEMRANKVFEFYRPDEIAECWEGIPRDLYVRLWDLVDRYEKRSANIENMCPNDELGDNSVKKFWKFISPEDQAALNAACKLNED
jgi:hypothetical protein